MTIVSFNGISRSFPGNTIFESVTGIIRRGDRIGVVGPNGAGKTTFCRVLAGHDRPDSGEVTREKGLRIHYMEQEPALTSERGVLDELLVSCTEIRELEKTLAGYAARLDNGEELSPGELERYGTLMDRFEHLGGYSLRSRAEKILTGLGLPGNTFSQQVGSLSGGQKSRLSLARALINEPDLLFLDEPTNHLDLRAIEFLEELLRETTSTVVVISHDRAFLDRVTTRTAEVLGGRVSIRPGNYSEFAEWARAEAERMERERRNYERKVDQIEDFIRRNIYGQKTKQAQSRRKMLSRMQPPPEARREQSSPTWRMDVAQHSSSLVLEARGLGKAYPGGPPLFEDLDLTLMRGDTLAMIGDNGSGKSTLLGIFAGSTKQDNGTVELGRDVTIACLPQHVERPGNSRTVLDYMYSKAPELTLGEVRGLLGRFLFSGEEVEKSVDRLSEGEYRRLLLAGLIHSQANLLLLDEPTNHLDIYSREALQEALAGYPGTLVLITHDRSLLAALADRMLEFHAPGRMLPGQDKVVEYNGDYDYYKREREKLEKAVRNKPESRSGPRGARGAGGATGKEGAGGSTGKDNPAGEREEKSSAPAGKGKNGTGISKNELRRLRQRKEELENEIAVLEERKQELQLKLADPGTYRQEGRAAELASSLDQLEGRIEEAYGEWEKLIEYD